MDKYFACGHSYMIKIIQLIFDTLFENREHTNTPVSALAVAFEDAGAPDDKYWLIHESRSYDVFGFQYEYNPNG
jgi:hypothetical protein